MATSTWACGLIGGVPVGAVEMIGYDEASQAYRSQLFDSLGNLSTHELVLGADGCAWMGTTTRCTATFSEGGTVQTARHERTEDGVRFVPRVRAGCDRQQAARQPAAGQRTAFLGRSG